MFRIIILVTLLTGWAWSTNLTFTNTIIGGYSGNPCILKIGDYYYLTLQNYAYTELVVYKSPILTNFQNVEKSVILRAPDGFSRLSPNEMIEINGELYLYFHMKSQVADHRLYVIKADNSSNPMGGWGYPIRLLNDWEFISTEGAVMKHNCQLYFVWKNPSAKGSLFIAPLTAPTWVGNPKVLLREPQLSWECRSGCSAEGASFIYSKNMTYLIYSASSWGSADYCLGQMSIPEGVDPLVASNWQVSSHPVFWRNDDEDVYSTGVAEFTTSPDGTETWMIYHATISPVHIGFRQTARLEKITFNGDGSPRFPRPLGIHREKPVPSGETLTCV